MKLSEFINEAKSHIETDWTQLAYRTHTGQVCAISALERTAMAHLTEGGPTLLPKAKRMLESKVIEINPDLRFAVDNIIPNFNDRQNTTQEDVLAIFDKARTAAEEMGE